MSTTMKHKTSTRDMKTIKTDHIYVIQLIFSYSSELYINNDNKHSICQQTLNGRQWELTKEKCTFLTYTCRTLGQSLIFHRYTVYIWWWKHCCHCPICMEKSPQQKMNLLLVEIQNKLIVQNWYRKLFFGIQTILKMKKFKLFPLMTSWKRSVEQGIDRKRVILE